MNRKQTAAVLIISILFVAGVILTQIPTRLGLIAVSSATIEPNGYLSGSKLEGTYWLVTLSVDYATQISFTFDNATVHANGANPTFNGQALSVLNPITITITPGQPYYIRPMEEIVTTVVPGAYRDFWSDLTQQGRDKSVDAVSPYQPIRWVTTSSDWMLCTPFTVSVVSNGVSIGTYTILNVGTATTTSISLGSTLQFPNNQSAVDNSVYVTDLGSLVQSATPANWASLQWFSNQYFFLGSTAITHALTNPYPVGDGKTASVSYLTDATAYDNTYAYYWYMQDGSSVYTGYWQDDGTPFPGGASNGLQVLGPSTSPGWDDGGSALGILWRRIPSQSQLSSGMPPTFPTDPTPTGKSITPLSLVGFLEQDIGAQDIAQASNGLLPTWDHPTGSGLTLINSGNNAGWLKEMLPYGAFDPVVTLEIGSAICNTVVYTPIAGNFKITSVSANLGTIAADESLTVPITIQQTATVASPGATGTVTLTSPSNTYVQITPESWATPAMMAGTSQTFDFVVKNLGSPTTVTSSFGVSVANSLGVVTDSATVKFTLSALSTIGSVLVVTTVDHDTGLAVSGIFVIVQYGTTEQTGYTANGMVSFNFEGGTPSVTISTSATSTYQSASTIYQIHSGENPVTLQLLKIGEPPPVQIPWLLIAVVAVATIVLVVAVVTVKRRGGMTK